MLLPRPGAGTQVGSVAEHIGQWDLGPHDVACAPLLHALDPAATTTDRHDVAQISSGVTTSTSMMGSRRTGRAAAPPS